MVNPVRPFEKAKLSGIYTAMGRPLGAKNKRTLLREANMRGAAARAQFDLAITDDELIRADSLAVMEDAMAYFYGLALKERHRNGDADPKAIRDNLREAVTIAKEVAPYRHPRLSSVKVGSLEFAERARCKPMRLASPSGRPRLRSPNTIGKGRMPRAVIFRKRYKTRSHVSRLSKPTNM